MASSATTLTVVTYHYVRERSLTRYPRLNALDRSAFAAQLEHFSCHYEFVSVDDCLAALDGAQLPPNALLLTFDDGYLDHYVNAVPLMERYGALGAFFPAVASARDRQLLEVNKIQLVLASAAGIEQLAAQLRSLVEDHGDELGLDPWEQYEDEWAVASRFDDARTRLVKNLLQKGLPVTARDRFVDELFRTHVDIAPEVIAEELYMGTDHLRSLLARGHHVGSHGVRHLWLDHTTDAELHSELTESRAFLEGLGVGTGQLTICYPHGGCDDRVLDAVRTTGYRLGFAGDTGLADLGGEPLSLARLDATDFPREAGSDPNDWTMRVVGHGR